MRIPQVAHNQHRSVCMILVCMSAVRNSNTRACHIHSTQCGAETCLRCILWGGLGSPILKSFQEAVCHRFAVHCGCRDACSCTLHTHRAVSMCENCRSASHKVVCW